MSHGLIKYKIGSRVEYLSPRTRMTSVGRVVGSDVKATGQFVAVNFAEKGENPKIVQCRPSALTKL